MRYQATGPRLHDAGATTLDLLCGTSVAVRIVTRSIPGVARAGANLLVLGERGTGKRALAEAIHAESSKGMLPFRVVPASRFDDALLTEASAIGTLYIEDVETLTSAAQDQLTVAIAGREARHAPRVIGSSSAPLDDLIRLGRFRRDLLYRLGAIRLTIPPLRARQEDVTVLATTLLRRWCARTGNVVTLLPEALRVLRAYSWPGNARELEATLEAALAVTRGGEISAERIRTVLGNRPQRHAAPDVFPLRQIERDYITSVLIDCRWNQSLAARRLGIGRNTLMRKIKTFNLVAGEGVFPRGPGLTR